jgi:hypothetical protein
MITYLYWIGVIVLAFGLFYFIGYKVEEWKIAAIAAFTVLAIGFVAYTFHFQQIFVKRYGGIMTVNVPAGELHLAATWKDDNLWIENYNPQTNACHFREYSRGNMLQGEVIIKNCNPLLRQPGNLEMNRP